MNKLSIAEELLADNPEQVLYAEAVREVAADIEPYLLDRDVDEEQCARWGRILLPEKIVQFRVDWKNDLGEIQSNWGYRVQHNSARGPYKGGLRLDRSVEVDTLKFLALEQTFKNALTGLPLGSGKGGSDFSPKGKSEEEIARFCRAFMRGLYPYIGKGIDIPAGDIGVGEREIAHMLEEYQILSGKEVVEALTGKPVEQHGSYGRTEATGYGLVYFVHKILENQNDSFTNKSVAISGSGNVATYAALKVLELGGKVVSLSDRQGYIHKQKGFTSEEIENIIEHKAYRKTLSELQLEDSEYHEGACWQSVKAEIYFPCATQNELTVEDAHAIIEVGALIVAEGANMPCTTDAVETLQKSKTIFAPAKAANAGGVAVSGLEMEQNNKGVQWSSEEVDTKLKDIMCDIFQTTSKYGCKENGDIDYLKGANIGGYVLLDKAMREQGL